MPDDELACTDPAHPRTGTWCPTCHGEPADTYPADYNLDHCQPADTNPAA